MGDIWFVPVGLLPNLSITSQKRHVSVFKISPRWHVDIKMDWTEVAMAKQPLGAGPYGSWSLRLPCRPGLPSAVLKIIVPKRKLTPGSHGTTWPWQDQCFVRYHFLFFLSKQKRKGCRPPVAPIHVRPQQLENWLVRSQEGPLWKGSMFLDHRGIE